MSAPLVTLHALQPGRPLVPRLEPERFVTLARASAVPAGATIALQAATDTAQGRTFQFTAATSSPNRNGWRVEADGWDLAGYKANPTVLWTHMDEALPLGRTTDLRFERNLLRATVEFTPKGMLDFNDAVVELLRTRFLSGISVGILPLEWRYDELPNGDLVLVFEKVQLVELSIVNIPADAGALADVPTTPATAKALAALQVFKRRLAIAELTTPSRWLDVSEAVLAGVLARRALLAVSDVAPSDMARLVGALAHCDRRLRILELDVATH